MHEHVQANGAEKGVGAEVKGGQHGKAAGAGGVPWSTQLLKIRFAPSPHQGARTEPHQFVLLKQIKVLDVDVVFRLHIGNRCTAPAGVVEKHLRAKRGGCVCVCACVSVCVRVRAANIGVESQHLAPRKGDSVPSTIHRSTTHGHQNQTQTRQTQTPRYTRTRADLEEVAVKERQRLLDHLVARVAGVQAPAHNPDANLVLRLPRKPRHLHRLRGKSPPEDKVIE